MQRVYITSCPSRFCGQALDTKTYRDVKTFCYLDKHGIEIQISSTSGRNTNVWVSYPEAQNHHVDEFRYNDPEYSPQKEQPTIQSGPQFSPSDDHNPIRERKWEDIAANEFSHKHELGHHLSKFVGEIGTSRKSP